MTKLFKITVSFGSVNSLISLPGAMSHASIPAEVRARREFPEDLVRISCGVEFIDDLVHDLANALDSYVPAPVSPTRGSRGLSPKRATPPPLAVSDVEQ